MIKTMLSILTVDIADMSDRLEMVGLSIIVILLLIFLSNMVRK